MKRIFCLALILCLLLSCHISADINYSQRSVLKSFVSQSAKMIAFFAHPTADYESSSVTVEDNKATLSITYRSNWTKKYFYMDIVVSVDENTALIDDIYVKQDGAFIPAFSAITAFKEIITELLKEENSSDDKQKNQILETLREKWESLDGQQLCFLILLYYWIDKGDRNMFQREE